MAVRSAQRYPVPGKADRVLLIDDTLANSKLFVMRMGDGTFLVSYLVG
ncbi:MAG: hypothetical protein K2I93_08615 [Oscillospiraceae bacterium]|nr:hypothetical protein [Oscillospiraceae bacterium]